MAVGVVGRAMRDFLHSVDDFLDSPMGGLVSFGMVFAIRAAWPILVASARKVVKPKRKGAEKNDPPKKLPTPIRPSMPRG